MESVSCDACLFFRNVFFIWLVLALDHILCNCFSANYNRNFVYRHLKLSKISSPLRKSEIKRNLELYFLHVILYSSDGQVVRASASGAVDSGLIQSRVKAML